MIFTSCKKSVEAMSSGLDGPQSAWTRFQVWAHFALCPPCRVYERQLRLMRRLVKRAFAEDLAASAAIDDDLCCGKHHAHPAQSSNGHREASPAPGLTPEHREQIRVAMLRESATANPSPLV